MTKFKDKISLSANTPCIEYYSLCKICPQQIKQSALLWLIPLNQNQKIHHTHMVCNIMIATEAIHIIEL